MLPQKSQLQLGNNPDQLHLLAGARSDQSPPRKRRGISAEPQTDSSGRPRFMADGGRAGKVTGQELAAEMAAKAAKEAADFAAMGIQVTGRGAQTVRFICEFHCRNALTSGVCCDDL